MRQFIACLALVASALVLPVERASLSAQAVSSPLTVNVKSEPDAQVLVGFIVNGTEQQAASIESAASGAGVLSTRVDKPANGGPVEVMVIFREPYDHGQALALFRRAQHLDFGTSKVEAMLITQANYQSNGIKGEDINKYPAHAVQE